MNYNLMLFAADSFAEEHPTLNGLITAIKGLGNTFGQLADQLYTMNMDLNSSKLAAALESIGMGLVTFFLVLEIVTFAFNVDFHAGFESGLKLGVRLILLYIIEENCMRAAELVLGIFKMENTVNFAENFAKIADGFELDKVDLTKNGWFNTEALLYGVVLVLLTVVIFVIFSFLVISMIGIVAETTILTAIAPVACATLVNSQVRQTGITFLKNLAAISMQWGVIALCFDIYSEMCDKINFNAVFTSEANALIVAVFNTLSPVLCLITLAVMISKSGDILKRALGA